MTTEALAPPVVTEPGIYQMTNDEYHADPVPGGSLSSSGARKLLPPYCPAIYRWEQDHPVRKDVFDIGSAAHKLVLNDPDTIIQVVDAPDWRTKAAREQQQAARDNGLIPILADRYLELEAMAAAIRSHPTASRLFAPGTGRPEQSLFWLDDAAQPVWRRARLDWLPNPTGKRMILADYKTCRSADSQSFTRSAADYGYHQQCAWYLDAVRALGLDDDPAILLVAQEKTPPYLVNVIELDATALTIGRNLNRGAINIYAECQRTGIWPGYGDGVDLVSLPEWYVRRYDEDPTDKEAA